MNSKWDPKNNPELLRENHGKDADGGTVKLIANFPAITFRHQDLVHATVVQLNTNVAGDPMNSVEISDPEGRRTIVRSRAFVLCAGGIENAQNPSVVQIALVQSASVMSTVTTHFS